MTQEKMFKKFDNYLITEIMASVSSVQFNAGLLVRDLMYDYFNPKDNVDEKSIYDALIQYANGSNTIVVNKKSYMIESTVFIQNGKETYPYEHHFITFIFTEVPNEKAPGLIEKLCNLFKK